MLASDPRFGQYDALQRLLCAALNVDVHWDTAHAPIDRVLWAACDRDAAAEAIKARMNRLMRSGLDG